MELTIEQVKAFFEEFKDRADVVEYLSTLVTEKPLSLETVNAYLGTGEGKNLLQPILDRYATQAIKTHDEKQKPVIEATVKAKVNEELQRLNPSETPEQRMIRELKDNQDSMMKQMEKERLDYAITQEYAKRNIPLEFAKDIPWPSIEHAVNGALVWETVKNKELDRLVNERVATMQKKPELGQQREDGDPTKGMTSAEKVKYYADKAMEREQPKG